MKDTWYVMVCCAIMLTVSIVLSIWQHPEDETKQLIAGNRAMLMVFFCLWVYDSVSRDKR